MTRKIDRGLLARLFKAYLSMAGYGVFTERVDAGIMGLGRIRVERVSESGERLMDLVDGLLCDCLVQLGGEDDMVYFMLERAFGDGEPVIHLFNVIGLDKIRSLPELTLKLAAMVPAR